MGAKPPALVCVSCLQSGFAVQMDGLSAQLAQAGAHCTEGRQSLEQLLAQQRTAARELAELQLQLNQRKSEMLNMLTLSGQDLIMAGVCRGGG